MTWHIFLKITSLVAVYVESRVWETWTKCQDAQWTRSHFRGWGPEGRSEGLIHSHYNALTIRNAT